MARIPMVTRTFVGTEISVLACNTETAECFNTSCSVSGEYKCDEKALKVAKKMLDTDTVKCVSVVAVKPVQELRGLKMNDFYKYSTVLDPKTRKVLEDGTEIIEDGTEEATENI